jgi:hypothetical protein
MKRCLFLSASIVIFLTNGLGNIRAQESEEQKETIGNKTPTIEELLRLSEEAIAKVKDYTGTLIKKERIDGELVTQKTNFKFSRPFKVYIKFIKPHSGREVIYVKGWNDGELRVHKGSFPDITLNLDPYGSMAMEDNHHSITHFGLQNTIKISGKTIRQALKKNEGTFKVSDGGIVFGHPTWKVETTLPKKGYNVIAKDDETLWDISKRTGQDMYIILYSNKDYDDPDDVDEGDKVFIPRYYGGKAELYISKKTHLPVKVSTWDWKNRLYESYEYPDTKLNVGLSKNDFNPDNKSYNF